MNEDLIRERVREYLQTMIDEMTTTGDVAGYLTPRAFAGNANAGKRRIKQIAQQLGFKLTKKGKKDVARGADKMEQITEAYVAELKLLSEDIQELKPHQQLGKSISEIHKQIYQIELAIKRHKKFKVKENVQSDQLWKRTLRQLIKLESRLLSIATQIREIRN